MKEIWKEVKGYECLYEISNLGRVKSLEKNSKPERIIKPHIGDRGYKAVNLCKCGIQKTKRIHQLVAIAFLNHTPCGHKLVVDHIDNDPLNNRVDNLQVITHRENTSKDRKGGTSKYIGVKQMKTKWEASIFIDGRGIYLGLFKNEIDASNAYINSLEDYKNGCFVANKYNEFKPTSNYKGVSWHKGNKSWQAMVLDKVLKKQVFLGYSKCELGALHKITTYKKQSPELN